MEDLTPELGSLGTSKLIQRFLTPRRSKTPSLGSERRLGLSSSPKGWVTRQIDNQQYVETDKEDEGQTLLLHKPQKNNCDSLGLLPTAATAPRVGRYKPNDLRGKQAVKQEVVIAEEDPVRNNSPVMFTPIVVLSETVSDAVMSDGCIHHSGSIGHNALIRENEPKLETVEMGKATDSKDYDMTIEPSNPRTEPTAARKLTFAPVTFQNLDTTRHLPNQTHLDPNNLPPPAQTETSGAFEVRTLIFSLAEDIEGMLKEYFCLDIKGVRAIISQASAKMDSNEHQDMAHIPDLLPIHSSAHALMQQLPEDPSEKITFADCLMRILQHKEIKDMDPFQLLGDLGDDGNGSKAGDEYKLHDEGDYLELSDTGSVDSDTFPTVCHNQGLASNPPPLCLSRTFSQAQSQARPGTPQFLRVVSL